MSAFGKYPSPVLHEINYDLCQPIEVIASFNPEGKFIPFYFKYVAADQTVYKYKIEAIKYTRDYDQSTLFCCLYTNNGKQYELLLSYWSKDCIWTIPRA
jgi:hypothetical protein